MRRERSASCRLEHLFAAGGTDQRGGLIPGGMAVDKDNVGAIEVAQGRGFVVGERAVLLAQGGVFMKR